MSLMHAAQSIAAAPHALGGAVTANLDQPAHYLLWGPIQISVANLVIIGVGLVLFVLAIAIPFPKGRKRP
jgi:hypothetical protein